MAARSERNVERIVSSIKPVNFLDDPYDFDLDRTGFPVFSDKNIAFVNALVQNDSAYNFVSGDDVHAMYCGAANGGENEIRNAVYLTDKVNSTHLAAVSVGEGQNQLMQNLATDEWLEIAGSKFMPIDAAKKMDSEENVNAENKTSKDEEMIRLKGGTLLTAACLLKDYMGNGRLKDDLCNKNADDRSILVAKIARAVTNMTHNMLPEHLRVSNQYNRSNFSFASKFCHHACRNVTNFQMDNFCIYDKVVGEMLPYYADAYVDEEWLNKWCEKYNKNAKGHSNCSAYSNRYAWIRGTIRKKLVATPDAIGEDADAQVARGYRGYLELYSHVVDGINEWRRNNQQFGRLSGYPTSDIGFHEVDLMIWYYFKGRRVVDAKNEMKALAR